MRFSQLRILSPGRQMNRGSYSRGGTQISAQVKIDNMAKLAWTRPVEIARFYEDYARFDDREAMSADGLFLCEIFLPQLGDSDKKPTYMVIMDTLSPTSTPLFFGRVETEASSFSMGV